MCVHVLPVSTCSRKQCVSAALRWRQLHSCCYSICAASLFETDGVKEAFSAAAGEPVGYESVGDAADH